MPENLTPSPDNPSSCECCGCCGHLPDDCLCGHCERCGTLVRAVCIRCDGCESCCRCVDCSDCGRRITRGEQYTFTGNSQNYCRDCYRERYVYCSCCGEDVSRDHPWCDDCDTCNACCLCEERAVRDSVPLVTAPRPPRFHRPLKHQLTINPCPRLAALEIECCGFRGTRVSKRTVADVVRKWGAGIVEDGSLPCAGREITTAPAGGDLLVTQLTEISHTLHAARAYVDTSAGLHVHVDARDLSWWDIRRLVVLYARIEPALLSVLPPSRRNNRYCLPCGQRYLNYLQQAPCRAQRKALVQAVYGTTQECRYEKTNKYCHKRYAALNLHSWWHRGTIECRLFPGTVDCRKMLHWARLWCSIVSAAATWTDKRVNSLPPTWDALLSLAPDHATSAWLTARRQRFTMATLEDN